VKKILLISDIFPPQIGGPATFMDHLGYALAKLGYHVTVICSSDQLHDPDDLKRPFKVRRVQYGNRITYGVALRFWLLIGMLTHDVILVNNLEYPSFQVAKFLSRSYVLKIVGDTAWENARNLGLVSEDIDEFQKSLHLNPIINKTIKRRDLYLGRASQIITPSNYLRNVIIKWGVTERDIQVIPNGVPLEDFREYKPKKRRDGEKLKVVFSGRLVNWKGVETLLLAVVHNPQIMVTILGDGPEQPMFEILAMQLQISDRVNFKGKLIGEAYRKELAEAHVLVLTSSYEGHSHTLLEASAAGLACIASNVGGNPEIITDHRNGLLVPYGDTSALRLALELLADNEDYRFQLACLAHERVQQFAFEKTVLNVVECLERKA
jgi:glycosyltransferase involved in cell wall biosynthesis